MAATSDTIQLWSIRLSDRQHDLSICREVLQTDEIERAKRFLKPIDRDRFILCRGLLRRILSEELDTDPSAIRFHRSEQGKPYLPDSSLQFNISHSGDRLLVAAACDRALGVDIEFRRAGIQQDAIAKRFFSPNECASFQSAENPLTAFFDIWSKKEAYVKALGEGIFRELSSFTVPLDAPPGTSPTGHIDDWFFQTLEIDPAYSAALVWQQLPTDTTRPTLNLL